MAAGVRVPGAALARAIGERILCAVSLTGRCGSPHLLVSVYGEDVAALVRAHAPSIAYEKGMEALPVDFRRCREPKCSNGREEGYVSRSLAGHPVAVFVHVVDCRGARADASARCSGDRAGNLYLQYWLYYPDSATLRALPGSAGYHPDDWESFQVRIGPDGETDVRASSHHGFNHERGMRNWASDADIPVLEQVVEKAGVRSAAGWGPETGWLYVSGGSHAGSARGNPRDVGRVTPRSRLRLIALEPLAGRLPPFVVAPPWMKEVWTDPEAEGTS
ncbi:MAG TPA: hypothetical protein VKA89_03860 [Solirubrobacterales bacterium]|nr:hypothetical protein [Solirubrobacterales bacterium]